MSLVPFLQAENSILAPSILWHHHLLGSIFLLHFDHFFTISYEYSFTSLPSTLLFQDLVLCPRFRAVLSPVKISCMLVASLTSKRHRYGRCLPSVADASGASSRGIFTEMPCKNLKQLINLPQQTCFSPAALSQHHINPDTWISILGNPHSSKVFFSHLSIFLIFS